MIEEWYLENDRLHSFVDTVDEAADAYEEIPDLLAALHDPFREMLTDDEWLPDPDEGLVPDGYDDKGEMGVEISRWLLYRRPGKLLVFTPALRLGGETPGQDHLAWGLVGIYDGAQIEEFYRRTDDGETDVGVVDLEDLRSEEMREGDFYELLELDDNIHHVRTSSDVPSVSVHLLDADVGRIQRHQFAPDAEFVELFQSHDTNVRCEAALAPPDQHGHTHTHSHGH